MIKFLLGTLLFSCASIVYASSLLEVDLTAQPTDLIPFHTILTREVVAKPKRVGIIGCGSGIEVIAANLAWEEASIIAFDINKQRILKALKNCNACGKSKKKIRIVNADLMQPRAETFDLIIMRHPGPIYPASEKEIWKTIAENVLTMLVPGGTLLLTTGFFGELKFFDQILSTSLQRVASSYINPDKNAAGKDYWRATYIKAEGAD